MRSFMRMLLSRSPTFSLVSTSRGSPSQPIGDRDFQWFRLQVQRDSEVINWRGGKFEPSRIDALPERPTRLALTRIDAQNCGRRVVIPELGVKRDLPHGRTA